MTTIFHAQFRRDQGHTVLLIGDNVGPLKTIAFALQRQGHTVLWAQKGREALRSVRLESPDIVVCEIDLPDLNGFEVCQMIKSSLLNRPPVVLVGRPGKEVEDSPLGVKVGADDMIGDLSDTRYVLARLEWLARRSGSGRKHAPEFAASVRSATRSVKRSN
jgi:two-component system, OmpR family, alkaline phosphatase synthesis response regulator PhoP